MDERIEASKFKRGGKPVAAARGRIGRREKQKVGGGRRRVEKADGPDCGPKEKKRNKTKGKKRNRPTGPVRKGKKERREIRKKEGGKKGK